MEDEKPVFSDAANEVICRIIDHFGYDPFWERWQSFLSGWYRTQLLFGSSDKTLHGTPLGVKVWAREEEGFVYVLCCGDDNESVEWAKAKVPTLQDLDATIQPGWSPASYVREEAHLPWFSAHLVDDPEQLPPWLSEILPNQDDTK